MDFQRRLLKSKIHRATVTDADINYEGSISLPPSLIEAAQLLEFEAVSIWNVTTPARFETYVIRGDENGSVRINGSAAHYAKPGDVVIIASFIGLQDEEARIWQPTLVYVDRKNGIREIKRGTLDLDQAVNS